MAEKVNLAPRDKYADDPKAAAKADRAMHEKLESGLVGGSFPASDPPSITQPAPSKHDAGENRKRRAHGSVQVARSITKP